MQLITNFELTRDEPSGRRFAKEFIDGMGPEKAIKIARILLNDYGQYSITQLLKEEILAPVDGREDLYYLRIDRKLSVRLLGTIRGNTIHLVHGVKKEPMRPISKGHYDTAEMRIKRIAR